jgi:hypothetical protein
MACVNHPELTEATHCDQCARPVCEDCYVVIAGRAFCGACKDDVVRRLERGEMLSSNEREPSPWERQPSLSSFKQTLLDALLRPSRFFARLGHQGSAAYLGFAVLAAWPSNFVGQTLWGALQALMIGKAEGLVLLGFYAGSGLILTPIQVLINIVMWGAIVHLGLKLVGGANGPIEATLRTVGYAQAAHVFTFVPMLGGMVAGIWALVTLVIGLKEMHETSYGRVVVAVFLPGVLCCLLLAPFFVLIFVLEAMK